MVTIKLTLTSAVPAEGFKVEYRVKGSTGAYTQAPGNPYMTKTIQFSITAAAGTLYEGHIWSDCGGLESTKINWTTQCDCTHAGDGSGGYVAVGTECRKNESIAATMGDIICVAPSKHSAYTDYGSRIYNPGFNADTLFLPFTTPAGGTINKYLTTIGAAGYGMWINNVDNLVNGPMNRAGVWIDKPDINGDCDGERDAITDQQDVFTLSASFSNAGAARQIYIGIGADNDFQLLLNSIEIVDTTDHVGHIGSDMQYRVWHILPVNIITGINYINVVVHGDGTVLDSIAVTAYDSTIAQLTAATSDSQLTILFNTSGMLGDPYQLASCPSGYSLNTTGGVGNYTCVRSATDFCNKNTF